MEVNDQKVVVLHYTLTDNDGAVIDKSEDGSFAYLHGANNIIPGLETALIGKTAGDEISVSVTAEDGYGERDDAKLQEVPKTMFDDGSDIIVGSQFHAEGPDGQMLVVTVMEVKDDNVVIDGNHPLAGVDLNFDVKVIEVRDALAEELEHGHVHGPDGHHH